MKSMLYSTLVEVEVRVELGKITLGKLIKMVESK